MQSCWQDRRVSRVQSLLSLAPQQCIPQGLVPPQRGKGSPSAAATSWGCIFWRGAGMFCRARCCFRMVP